MRGKVWLVGAGPGDPGLITVRGLEVLSRAEVVLHDALAHPALLDAAPQAEIVDVGKRYGVESPSQEEITRRTIELARRGKRVVRLKGGDPFLFARGAEEASALAAAGIPFEIVPGVSSPVAASAYAGISLTHRELSSSVTFITGSDRSGKEWSPEAWSRLALATDTICVLMGMRRIEEITRALVAGGRSPTTPVAVVQWAAHPRQRVVTATLDTIVDAVKREGVANPAIILVGDVVRMRDELRWFDVQPLFGKRVLLPRPKEQAEASARSLRARGAEPVIFPLIEITEPADGAPLRDAARRLSSFDFVVFTSQNGVEHLFRALRADGRDARSFGSAKVAVIGPKTAAAIERHGIHPDVVAREYVGEGVADALLANGSPKRVLIVRAKEAREVLPELLRERGVDVEIAVAYETKPVSSERARELARSFESGGIDVVLFTSASTVASLCDLLGARASELLSRTVVASIGPVTSRALGERSIRVDVTALESTVDGALDALSEYLRLAAPLI
jgi:uroporphyrinogen III methyltransferase/synthase